MGKACPTQQMGIVWGRQEGRGPQDLSWAHSSHQPGEQARASGLLDPKRKDGPRAPRRRSLPAVFPASWACTGAVVAWYIGATSQ